MQRLTLDQIVEVDDLPSKEVEVPAWGGSVKIRMLTKHQQNEIKTACVDEKGNLDIDKMELALLCEAIIEPELTQEHAKFLMNKNADVVDELIAEVLTMSALDKEAIARSREEFHDGPEKVDRVPSGEDVADVEEKDAPGDVHEGVH